MCQPTSKVIIGSDDITAIILDPALNQPEIDIHKLSGPFISCVTLMKCCQCNEYTELVAGAPGSTSCETCGHYECHSCDFE